MEKQICLITGATEGVGKATAIELARKGFIVVLAARDPAKAQRVIKEIAAAAGNADADHILGDLRSLRQVRQLAETFKQRYPRLDVLINNAGIFMEARELTEDGFETMFQVNYLSHVLLTLLLQEHLLKSEQGRIINLSSSVYILGKLDMNNMQSERSVSVLGTYSNSKLFTTMFTVELGNRLRATPVTVNAVHPGIVRTQMVWHAPGFYKLISYAALPVAVSPKKGAATSVYLATSKDVTRVSGKYFAHCKAADIKNKFNTEQNRQLLWNLSLKYLEQSVEDGRAALKA